LKNYLKGKYIISYTTTNKIIFKMPFKDKYIISYTITNKSVALESASLSESPSARQWANAAFMLFLRPIVLFCLVVRVDINYCVAVKVWKIIIAHRFDADFHSLVWVGHPKRRRIESKCAFNDVVFTYLKTKQNSLEKRNGKTDKWYRSGE